MACGPVCKYINKAIFMRSDLPAHPALFASIAPLGEADALVRFFACPDGELLLKARGLRRSASKLAHLLQPADELEVRRARGRTQTDVLTGVSVHRAHPGWRESLRRLALYWFLMECALTGSGAPGLNEQVFQLLVNLLRSAPEGEAAEYGSLCAFSLKLLSLHGLLPSLDRCALDGHLLAPDEPVHLLPNGEGLVGREAYNARYARSGGGLLRMEAERAARWRRLQHGALLEYATVGADAWDAAVLLHHTSQRLADLAAKPLPAAGFLRKSWKLQGVEQLLAVQRLSGG